MRRWKEKGKLEGLQPGGGQERWWDQLADFLLTHCLWKELMDVQSSAGGEPSWDSDQQ